MKSWISKRLEDILEKMSPWQRFSFRLWQLNMNFQSLLWKIFYYFPKDTYFRIRHGFWPKQWWNFKSELAIHILPILKYYRKNTSGYPIITTNEEWKIILDKIINSFQLIADQDDGPAKKEEINEGLTLFAKYYQNLWD